MGWIMQIFCLKSQAPPMAIASSAYGASYKLLLVPAISHKSLFRGLDFKSVRIIFDI